MYRVEFRPAALRALRQIDARDHDRIRGAIALLAQDPRPPGMMKLRGRDGYRVRVGSSRIIYAIHDDLILIVIVTIGHRRDVYR